MSWLLWGRYFKGWGDSPIGWRESVAFFPFERISPQLSTTSQVIQEGWCKTSWWRWLDRWLKRVLTPSEYCMYAPFWGPQCLNGLRRVGMGFLRRPVNQQKPGIGVSETPKSSSLITMVSHKPFTCSLQPITHPPNPPQMPSWKEDKGGTEL